MKKFVAMLVVALGLAVASAQDYTVETEFVLIGMVDGVETVVGYGEWSAEGLELELLDGYNGAVTMQAISDDGAAFTVESVDVFGGQVFVGAEYADLSGLVGGALEVTFESEIEKDASEFDAEVEVEGEEEGLDITSLPQQAQDGMARAAANRASAAARSEGRSGDDDEAETSDVEEDARDDEEEEDRGRGGDERDERGQRGGDDEDEAEVEEVEEVETEDESEDEDDTDEDEEDADEEEEDDKDDDEEEDEDEE